MFAVAVALVLTGGRVASAESRGFTITVTIPATARVEMPLGDLFLDGVVSDGARRAAPRATTVVASLPFVLRGNAPVRLLAEVPEPFGAADPEEPCYVMLSVGGRAAGPIALGQPLSLDLGSAPMYGPLRGQVRLLSRARQGGSDPSAPRSGGVGASRVVLSAHTY